MIKTNSTLSAAFLMLATPLILYDPSLFYLLLIPSLLMIGFTGMKTKTLLVKTPLDIPILVLLVSIWISAVFVANPFHSHPRTALILLYILLFYALVSLFEMKNWMQAGVVSFLGLGLCLAVFGGLGMRSLNTKYLGFIANVQASLPSLNISLPGAEEGLHPNAVGGLLILFIPLFFVLVIKNDENQERFLSGRRWRIFAFSGLIISVFVLILTQSRGSWAGLFFGLSILMLSKTKKKKVMIITLLVIMILLSSFLYYSFNKMDSAQAIARQVQDTIDFRLEMWDLAVRSIQSHPLLGIGLNEFRYQPWVSYEFSHAHNLFLTIAIELGVPSVLIFMILLICLWTMAFSVWKNSPSFLSKHLMLGLGGGQVAYFVFSLTDGIRIGSRAGVFFWISAAFITALYVDSTRNLPEGRKL